MAWTLLIRRVVFANSGFEKAAGRGGVSAYHSSLHLESNLFKEHGTNGINEFRDKQRHEVEWRAPEWDLGGLEGVVRRL